MTNCRKDSKAEQKDSSELEEECMTFKLYGKELETYRQWYKLHKCEFTKPGSTGAIGGRLTYSFTPTSLGSAVTIKCACGEKINVTDYENW
jgi:hypothetical protein